MSPTPDKGWATAIRRAEGSRSVIAGITRRRWRIGRQGRRPERAQPTLAFCVRRPGERCAAERPSFRPSFFVYARIDIVPLRDAGRAIEAHAAAALCAGFFDISYSCVAMATEAANR